MDDRLENSQEVWPLVGNKSLHERYSNPKADGDWSRCYSRLSDEQLFEDLERGLMLQYVCPQIKKRFFEMKNRISNE